MFKGWGRVFLRGQLFFPVVHKKKFIFPLLEYIYLKIMHFRPFMLRPLDIRLLRFEFLQMLSDLLSEQFDLNITYIT